MVKDGHTEAMRWSIWRSRGVTVCMLFYPVCTKCNNRDLVFPFAKCRCRILFPCSRTERDESIPSTIFILPSIALDRDFPLPQYASRLVSLQPLMLTISSKTKRHGPFPIHLRAVLAWRSLRVRLFSSLLYAGCKICIANVCPILFQWDLENLCSLSPFVPPYPMSR